MIWSSGQLWLSTSPWSGQAESSWPAFRFTAGKHRGQADRPIRDVVTTYFWPDPSSKESCQLWVLQTKPQCFQHNIVQFSSVAQSCLTLFDPMNHSTPGLPVHHQLPEVTQTHVHRVGDVIQPCYICVSDSVFFFNRMLTSEYHRITEMDFWVQNKLFALVLWSSIFTYYYTSYSI